MSGADEPNKKAPVEEVARGGAPDASVRRSRVRDALSGACEPAPAGQPKTAEDKPPLSTEQMAELLSALKDCFDNTPEHYNNHAFRKHREGIAFEEVRICLENDPVLAWIVYAMLKRDGKPDVWGRAGNSFLFFEAAKGTCPASRDCVYNQKSADWLKIDRPSEQFNGSVEEQRAEMGGADVASEALWSEIQKMGIFTINNSREWVNSDDFSDPSCARIGYRIGGQVVVQSIANDHYSSWGWRAVAKGSEA